MNDADLIHLRVLTEALACPVGLSPELVRAIRWAVRAVATDAERAKADPGFILVNPTAVEHAAACEAYGPSEMRPMFRAWLEGGV